MVDKKEQRIQEALQLLIELGMPREQQNQRSALCLLALLNLTPDKEWHEIETPLMGITPIMDWSKQHYDKEYAPNTRETFRRQSMHQFVQAGIARYNPDKLDRPVNSPHAVYQVETELFLALKEFGTETFTGKLAAWLQDRTTLIKRYSQERMMQMVPAYISEAQEIKLTPGAHSELIKAIIEQFAPRFVPGAKLIYAGDTGYKWGYFDPTLLETLGVTVDNHGKMPDVVFFYPEKNWLILVEAVTSHGPIDSKRYEELELLFKNSTVGLVYVSAFANKQALVKYLKFIAWETEVWFADNPTHLLHFNGIRFLGPYPKN